MKVTNFKKLSKKIIIYMLVFTSIFMHSNIHSIVEANDYYDSGNISGTANAPYIDKVLGFTRESLINELNRNRNLYLGTPFANTNANPYFTRHNTMRIGYAFNCTGFMATALERAGAKLGRLQPTPMVGHGTYSNMLRWSRFVIYNKKAASFKFNSVDALLKSGIAEKGDLIFIMPKSWANNDGHVGIFWGDTPSQNKFWHSPGTNTISHIYGNVRNPVYHLIKLTPKDPKIKVKLGIELPKVSPSSTKKSVPKTRQEVRVVDDTTRYVLDKSIDGYQNAQDALNRTNSYTTYPAGTYYVYKTAGKAINISRNQGSAGAWINLNDGRYAKRTITVNVEIPKEYPSVDPSSTRRSLPGGN